MTPEQEKALALARARKRKAEAQGGAMPSQAAPALAVAPTQEADAATNPYTQADTQYDPVTGVPIAGSFNNANPTTQTGPLDALAAGGLKGMTFGLVDEGNSKIAEMMRKFDAEHGLEGNPLPDMFDGANKEMETATAEYPGTALIGEIAGLSKVPMNLIRGGANPWLRGLAAAGSSGLVGAGYGATTADEGERLKGAALGGAGGAIAGGVISGLGSAGSKIYEALKQGAANKAFIKATPTAESLEKSASDLYDAGRKTGASATGKDTKALFDNMWNLGKAEAVITPKGRITNEMSSLSGTFRLLKDYSGKVMDPTAMQAVRASLTDALKNATGNEARIARKMLEQFDTFVETKVPEFSKAAKDFALAKGGQSVDEMKALAEARAGQFSNSGMENSIRTEARALDRKIIKGQERGYTPDEIALIEQMAKAPPAVVAQLNKFTPNGLMPLMAAGGAGGLLGGPVGAAVGVGLAGGGALTRAALTKGQNTRLELLNALRRTAAGELPKGAKVNPQVRAIIEALMRRGSIAGVTGGQQ